MAQNLSPVSITANKTTHLLAISWSDRHASEIPFTLLRAACPCAECRGGHENMRSEPPPDVFQAVLEDSPAVHVRRIEGVGSYALTIEWEDGHHFGIYNWRYLRLLCPCEDCRNINS